MQRERVLIDKMMPLQAGADVDLYLADSSTDDVTGRCLSL